MLYNHAAFANLFVPLQLFCYDVLITNGDLSLLLQIVDYIDYDTRDFTFNKVIPQAYQVMTVLMNYKRTVEDFKRCGSKSSTVYGLPYVSDCVGSNVDR